MGRPHITNAGLSLGADPEFFLRRKRSIIGSEEVIGKVGLRDSKYGSTFIRDGVQVELNLAPFTCRAAAGLVIAGAFRALKQELKKKFPGVQLGWEVLYKLSQKNLEGLSKESRILGCQPSFNIYDPGAEPGVDGASYPFRSAGGHIHMSLAPQIKKDEKALKRLVALCDVLLGNTAVLIDRDEGNIERRKVYGRAGEYRTPKHGLEYRTLSNFWLRSYPLMHLIMGLTKLAVSAHQQSILGVSTYSYTGGITYTKTKENCIEDLLSEIDQESIKEAINLNDAEIAWDNWKAVRKWIEEYVDKVSIPSPNPLYPVPMIGGWCGLQPGLLDQFEDFAEKVQQDGLEFFFPDEPLKHWSEKSEGSFAPPTPPILYRGSETFLGFIVPKMLKAKRKKEAA